MNYENVMKKCIELAKKGIGNVSPNPLVGCVILDNQGNIISEGYHEKYGCNHAERNAILNSDESLLKGATLVVNLEPCSHYGKTPPCADLIIEKGIKRVVTGMRDVNPVVAGNGIKKLQDAGVEVIEGVLEDECKQLNEVFIKNMTEHKPFIAIKTATTIDGKIATFNGSSKWITSAAARYEVKNIRSKYDAILTSSATVIADNPNMLHNQKIILDRELKTDFKHAEIYKTGRCFVFYDENLLPPLSTGAVVFIPVKTVDNMLCVEDVFSKAYELGIMSIIVEAGGHLNGSVLEYTDKIYQFIAPKILGDNNALSCFDYRFVNSIEDAVKFKIQEVQLFEPDVLITYKK